jgi:hypothetical protein
MSMDRRDRRGACQREDLQYQGDPPRLVHPSRLTRRARPASGSVDKGVTVPPPTYLLLRVDG